MSATRGPQGEAKAPAQQSFLEEALEVVADCEEQLQPEIDEIYEEMMTEIRKEMLKKAKRDGLEGITKKNWKMGQVVARVQRGDRPNSYFRSISMLLIDRAKEDPRMHGLEVEGAFRYGRNHGGITNYIEVNVSEAPASKS